MPGSWNLKNHTTQHTHTHTYTQLFNVVKLISFHYKYTRSWHLAYSGNQTPRLLLFLICWRWRLLFQQLLFKRSVYSWGN